MLSERTVERRVMRSFTGAVLFLGLLLKVVLCDQKCDEAMKDKDVTTKYADSMGSTDVVVCAELTQIKCNEDYPPSLVEKRPTLYFDVGKSCEYVTITFFGRSADSETLRLLWVSYNVPAEDLKNGFTGISGNERVIYKKPENASGEEDHYFFVYCQKSNLETFDCCTVIEREDFKPKAFAEKNKLSQVASAIYFRVTATGQLMNNSTDTQKGKACSRP